MDALRNILAGLGTLLLCSCATGISSVGLVSSENLSGTTEKVLVVTNRAADPDVGIRFNGQRSDQLSFAGVDVWVPENRNAGELRYPYGNFDPNKTFATAGYTPIANQSALVAEINQQLATIPDPADRRVVVFVHGFNIDYGEGIYRHAQIMHDFDIKGVAVHFSWPSAGEFSQYLYDRDSAHFSRDALMKTLEIVHGSNATSMMVFAHSMGSFLSMETLRQLSLDDRADILQKIDPLLLASPDIDMDVFRAQLNSLEPRPDNIITLVSKRDQALNLSERLRGGTDSVGRGDRIEELRELGVAIIDMTSLRDSFSTVHNSFAESPTLLSMFQSGQLRSIIDGSNNHEKRDTGIGMLSDFAASILYIPAIVMGDR